MFEVILEELLLDENSEEETTNLDSLGLSI